MGVSTMMPSSSPGYIGHADGPIAFYGHDIDVDGERMHVYPLGTRYWTWVEEERGSDPAT
jgi:hypothetical protein